MPILPTLLRGPRLSTRRPSQVLTAGADLGADRKAAHERPGQRRMRDTTRRAVLERDDYTCSYCGYRPTVGTWRQLAWWRIPSGTVLIHRAGDVVLRWSYDPDTFIPGGHRWHGTLHVDHIVPKARGGSDELANLVTACPPCNLRKRDRTPTEWQPWLG